MREYYRSAYDLVNDLLREYALYDCYISQNGDRITVEYGETDEEDVWPVIDELGRMGYHDIYLYGDHFEVWV